MSKRTEMINAFYDPHREDIRLEKSRHGQLEYLTTMHYIHKLIPKNSSVLEIGAGTGRYSIALAKEGHSVTAVELSHRNLALLQEHAQGIDDLISFQGDALDLSRLDDNSFDATLVLGPMYHLYEHRDQLQALSEAIRVTKPGGTIITAFLSIHAIMYNDYLQNNFRIGVRENFTENFHVRHFTEQLFTGFYIDEFEELFSGLPVEHLTTVASDGILELAEMTQSFSMSDEDFEIFTGYHLHNCEKREYLGSSSHLLHICKKTERKTL
ncbi:MAG: class I SAM-dependent methyltransferase [Ruminococcaceae bacterium]|nr:class I SAM-dependent methyltransferase [Oscillospiraceae bacterium]